MNTDLKEHYDYSKWLSEKELTPIEKTYLTILIWADKRLRIVDYLESMENLYYKINMQMPRSHTEQYNLDNKFNK